jgi:hypothetical protein
MGFSQVRKSQGANDSSSLRSYCDDINLVLRGVCVAGGEDIRCKSLNI